MKKEARNEMTGYPSIDRPGLKYYSDEAINVEIPHMTAYDYICLCNKNRLNETAINYFGRLITYEELFHKINKCASQFAQLGVGKGDIVSICMPTTVETIVAFYALNSIGAISDMLDPRSNKDQLKFYLKENESEILVLFDACYFKIKEIISETNIQKVILVSAADSMPTVTKIGYYIKNRKKQKKSLHDDLFITWKKFCELEENNKGKVVEYEKNKSALLVHSSGTVGTPKGILLSNDNLNALAFQYKLTSLELNRRERFLTAIPAFAAFGMVASVHLPLSLGLYTIVQPRVTAENMVKLCLKYKPNHCNTVPHNYEVLTSSKTVKDLSFFHNLGCGGDMINENLEKKIEDELIRKKSKGKLYKGWGMSELASTATLEMPTCRKIGSVGIPLVKNIISIFEPGTDKELTYDEQGEICVTGPSVMLGYFKNKELTDKVLQRHKDGKVWLHSGDIGHMSKQGVLTIDSRMERMIIRFDGFKIFPPSIENVITQHPDIEECAVIGIEDNANGKVPKAFLVMKHECKRDTGIIEGEIRELCTTKLAERAVPYYFEFIDELPMTMMGKVDYRKLEKEY